MPYQIIGFEPGGEARSQVLQERLRESLKELHPEGESEVCFLSAAEADGWDRKSPVVAFYFGGTTPATEAMRGSIRRLLDDSVTIVPIVDDPAKFKQYVPPELYPINGLRFDPAAPNYQTIAARLLEALSLLRETRRLFISYTRAESRAVAIQLYEALDGQGFDVFLDTVSIRSGDRFQDVLHHRLADVDVIVLLHTKGFMERRWTVEELTLANRLNVAILRVEWPDIAAWRQTLDPAEQDKIRRLDEQAALSVPFVLRPEHFTADGILQDAVCADIAQRTEGLRCRALAARQVRITGEFARQARDAGFEVLPQPEHHMILRKSEVTDRIGLPVVGAPSALAYEAFHRRIQASAAAHLIPLYIVYDHRALLEKHLAHLGWLDTELQSVRGIRVADAYATLAELE